MCILDLSKTLMNDFHYGYAKKKWKDLKLCFTDTDSLLYEIGTEDFFRDISEDVETMHDTSDFPKSGHSSSGIPVGKNKKVIGLMKDEACWQDHRGVCGSSAEALFPEDGRRKGIQEVQRCDKERREEVNLPRGLQKVCFFLK